MDGPKPVRVAEVLEAVSFASDLAFGLKVEDGARSCYVAMRIAERLGLSEDERRPELPVPEITQRPIEPRNAAPQRTV